SLQISLLRPRPPQTSTLLPYTTLFRSPPAAELDRDALRRRRPDAHLDRSVSERNRPQRSPPREPLFRRHGGDRTAGIEPQTRQRSEEHTSELQSPYDLVCRLLLEKKNI